MVYYYMDYKERKIGIRIPNAMYDALVEIWKPSEVIRDAIEMYLSNNVPLETSNDALWKKAHGEKPHISWIKNASYYMKLKEYKKIVNEPWEEIYVVDSWMMPKDVVMELLGIDASMFDPNDI